MKAQHLLMGLPAPYRQRARRVVYRCITAEQGGRIPYGVARTLAIGSYPDIAEALFAVWRASRDARISVSESPSFWRRMTYAYSALGGNPFDRRTCYRRYNSMSLPPCAPTIRYRSAAERRFCEV